MLRRCPDLTCGQTVRVLVQRVVVRETLQPAPLLAMSLNPELR